MINKIITKKLGIKPERVHELVIEIEQQGKIDTTFISSTRRSIGSRNALNVSQK